MNPKKGFEEYLAPTLADVERVAKEKGWHWSLPSERVGFIRCEVLKHNERGKRTFQWDEPKEGEWDSTADRKRAIAVMEIE